MVGSSDKPGVTVTTCDGITVQITGSPYFPDATLKRMFEDAMREVDRIRSENLGQKRA